MEWPWTTHKCNPCSSAKDDELTQCELGRWKSRVRILVLSEQEAANRPPHTIEGLLCKSLLKASRKGKFDHQGSGKAMEVRSWCGPEHQGKPNRWPSFAWDPTQHRCSEVWADASCIHIPPSIFLLPLVLLVFPSQLISLLTPPPHLLPLSL